jgi:hypothetical protein
MDELTIEELQAKVAELEQANEVLETVNAQLQKQVEVLSVKAESSIKVETGKVVAVSHIGKGFTNGGKKYVFNWPKQVVNGSAVTCDMVIADESLQAKLIASGSKMIKEA